MTGRGSQRFFPGSGLALGLAFGFLAGWAIGVALDAIGAGITLGAGGGVLAGMEMESAVGRDVTMSPRIRLALLITAAVVALIGVCGILDSLG